MDNIFSKKLFELVKESKFFNSKSGYVVKSKYLTEKKISALDFPLTFRKACGLLLLNNLLELLNTDSEKFEGINELTHGLVIKARDVFTKYLFNNYRDVHMDLELEDNTKRFTITKIPFFNIPIVEYSDISKIPEYKLSTNIIEFEFNDRFSHYLKQHKEIMTIEDLLHTNINDIFNFPNLAGNSIRQAQLVVFKFITSIDVPKNINLEDTILQRLKKILGSPNNINIFLEYYNYFSPKETILTEIGKKYKLSRERIRQIIEKGKKKVFMRKDVFKEIYEDMIKRGSVIELHSYLTLLINENQISESKRQFFYNLIINSVIFNDEFTFEKDYISLKGKVNINI